MLPAFISQIILNYPALSASTIFILAALKAGRTPPASPIMSEKRRDFQAISKVRVKEKASSEKVWKLSVEIVKSWRKEAKERPMHPPVRPRSMASIMNE